MGLLYFSVWVLFRSAVLLFMDLGSLLNFSSLAFISLNNKYRCFIISQFYYLYSFGSLTIYDGSYSWCLSIHIFVYRKWYLKHYRNN